MSGPDGKAVPRYLGVAVISGSVIALQVIFTRIFSIMIWHHFAYLVIGLAMLGGGAAGTFLVVRQWDRDTLDRRIGAVAVAFSFSILADLLAISLVEFDPLRRADPLQTIFGLTVYFAVLFTTFFLGGLVIASAFNLWIRHAHRLYFIDLLGAGLATLLVLPLTRVAGGPGALVTIAVLVLLAGLLFGGPWIERWRWACRLGLAGQVALLAWMVVSPLQLPIPASKELGWALRAQGAAAPEYTRWNPVARVDVMPEMTVEQPMIVGGVSAAWRHRVEDAPEKFPLRLVTLDGTSMTGIYRFDGDLSHFAFLRHAVIAAAYELGIERPRVLNIGVGGGLDVLLARLYGAASIKAIELNADVVALLRGPYADYGGRLAFDPSTELEVAEGRSYLIRDTSEYDVVQGIGLDNVAALSGGAYVLAESYLYTVESLDLALRRLSPRGVFAWTRDTMDPPREMLRLAGLAAEALRRRGVSAPGDHMAIVANDSARTATLLVAREPLAAGAVERLRQWADGNRFTLLHDPLNRLDTIYADYLRAPDPRAFERAYPFHVHPVYDDRPFFYNYFKWSSLTAEGTSGRLHRYPLGNLVLLTLLLLSSGAAIVFIVLPLLVHQRAGLRTRHALPMLVYFSLLGAAYIFVEIILIQRFTLFIGYPTLAIATTIFGMLTFSAVGSLLSQRLVVDPEHLRVAMLALVGLMALYIMGLPSLLNSWLWLPDAVRLLLTVVLIAPLAFFMGMPFPTGLSQVGHRAPSLVPWAMGLNGVFSVFGSSAVIFVSMMSSFTAALTVAAGLYALAAGLSGYVWRVQLDGSAGS